MWDLCDLQILANNLLYLNRPVGHCLQEYMLFSALQSYAHISLVEIWWGAAAVGDLRCINQQKRMDSKAGQGSIVGFKKLILDTRDDG